MPRITLSPTVIPNEVKNRTSLGTLNVMPPQEPPWGGLSGYFADLDGCFWEVAWHPDWRFREDGILVIE